MTLSVTERLRVDPELELSVPRSGLAMTRGASGSPPQIIEADTDELQAVLQAVREAGEVREIVAALAQRMSEASAMQWLTQLLELGWLERVEGAASTSPRSIGVLGSGALALRIEARLGDLDGVRAVRRDPASNAAYDAAELWVIAVEGTSFGELDEIGRRIVDLGRACLFVTYERHAVWIGPLTFPGSPGLLEARARLLPSPSTADVVAGLRSFSAQTLPDEHAGRRRLVEQAADEIAKEVRRVLDPHEIPALLSTVVAVGSERWVYPLFEQRQSVDGQEPAGSGRDFALELDVLRAREANLEERAGRNLPTRIATVGIIGGGTAGYLTALALRRARPELEVTLIESSKIPVIGVGEATTALLNPFLHRGLGLDIVDFYERVQPTWKLGIQFDWGRPGDYFYNSPFQFGKLLESLIYDRDINKNCLASVLMSADAAPIVQSDNGQLRSLLGEVPYAYHLDNRRFVRYLGEEARRAGVKHLDVVIAEAVPTPDRQAIDHVRTEDGLELRYDLYVDCTGFRSLLLGKALGSPFISYTPSLFTDVAVVANVPHGGKVKPYTVAETMDHGWCWNIPMEDEDHRGYVLASSFASIEQATSEMRSKNPEMGDTWTVKFRSGRYTDFWRGNCVAIGNSYAFVEPLQSTAIHMIIVEIQKLLRSFPRDKDLLSFQPLVNRDIAEVWDTLRWFLAAHYRYNEKLDTPFWRECRASTDVSGIEDLVELFRERAPIGSTAHQLKELDHSTFGAYRYDLLFLGMGLDTTLAIPDDDEATWRRSQAAVERLVARALPHAAALRAVRSHPEILRRHVSELG